MLYHDQTSTNQHILLLFLTRISRAGSEFGVFCICRLPYHVLHKAEHRGDSSSNKRLSPITFIQVTYTAHLDQNRRAENRLQSLVLLPPKPPVGHDTKH